MTHTLTLVDESGDSGFKLGLGSSPYFTMALVAFEDLNEAVACDKKIGLLKREMGWSQSDEFHFKNNSDTVRRKFLKAVVPYNFFYYGVVINKAPKIFPAEEFPTKQSFYNYACSLLFENAKDKLNNAVVIIDQSGDLDFKRQLAKFLREKVNGQAGNTIKEVKMQRSSSNNLLQLADYAAGAINRSMEKKRKFAGDYRKLLAHREIEVQVWPR